MHYIEVLQSYGNPIHWNASIYWVTNTLKCFNILGHQYIEMLQYIANYLFLQRTNCVRPKMGWNTPESNLQRGLDICLKNVKKGLFYSEYHSLYLHKRKTSFSGHISAIPLHVCLGYDFWSLLLPLIWRELSRSFSTLEKNIGWTWKRKSAFQGQNLHFQEHSPDLIWI